MGKNLVIVESPAKAKTIERYLGHDYKVTATVGHFRDLPDKTLFVITTDGMENSSYKYSYRKVKHMVERQKERYGWEFIFLGANIDAAEVAGRFGVDESRAVRYKSDSKGTRLNYKVMTEMVSMARCSESAEDMSRCFDEGTILEEIREDYKKRK